MKPETKLKLQNIILIVGMTLIFGLLYNYFFYPHTFVEFLEAGSISIILGLLIGMLEEFVLKKAFHSISSLGVTLIRILLYSSLISSILALVLSIEISFIEQISYREATVTYLSGKLFRRDFLFSMGFIAIVLFLLQIIQLIGRANFFRLFFGLYRQPREVSRIFMFLDLKGSTAIAEKLTNKTYSAFIRDFFMTYQMPLFCSEVKSINMSGTKLLWFGLQVNSTSIVFIVFLKWKKSSEEKKVNISQDTALYPNLKQVFMQGR